MSFDLEDGFDPAEMWAEKQRSRDEDRRALESGEKTIEQLARGERRVRTAGADLPCEPLGV